jgi:beta-galactosidase
MAASTAGERGKQCVKVQSSCAIAASSNAACIANKPPLPFPAIVVLLSFLAVRASTAGSDTLDLAGEWRLRLDPQDQGVTARWPASPLAGEDRITLPNTTDRAGFGFALDTNTMLHAVPFPVTTRFPGVKEPARADEHGYLVRRHLYVGSAWYERQIEIPAAWKGRALAESARRTRIGISAKRSRRPRCR